MKCKYKQFSNERLCQVIYGECQFVLCKYGPECPIYNGYPFWDKYSVETEAEKDPNHTAHIDNLATLDVFDETASTEAIVDVLDIITDD